MLASTLQAKGAATSPYASKSCGLPQDDRAWFQDHSLFHEHSSRLESREVCSSSVTL